MDPFTDFKRMTVLKLTATNLAEATSSDKGLKEIWDERCRGLCCWFAQAEKPHGPSVIGPRAVAHAE